MKPAARAHSVSVVIPSYNMDWCVARAVTSCQNQSLVVQEIIVVDDCSFDNTETIIRDLMTRDPRVKYRRHEMHKGHLAALRFGVLEGTSDWIALLDADDQLTPNSIEARVAAANEYIKETGIKPQLVYGDLTSCQFPRFKGDAFFYISRELSLCQTSTIMLGRESIPYFPISNNEYNTDDEIVLAIGKHFHVLHSDTVVAAYHEHDSPTRMSNNAKRVYSGWRQLVRDHRDDIIREHGIRRLLTWRLRLFIALVDYQVSTTSEMMKSSKVGLSRYIYQIILIPYQKMLMCLKFASVMLWKILAKVLSPDPKWERTKTSSSSTAFESRELC